MKMVQSYSTLKESSNTTTRVTYINLDLTTCLTKLFNNLFCLIHGFPFVHSSYLTNFTGEQNEKNTKY